MSAFGVSSVIIEFKQSLKVNNVRFAPNIFELFVFKFFKYFFERKKSVK